MGYRQNVAAEQAPEPSGILLMNCHACEDILRLDERLSRPCLCGESTARFVGGKWILAGRARLIRIPYEDYDGAAPGVPKRWELV